MPVLGVGRRRGRSTLVLRHGRDLFAATADRGSDPDRSGVLKSLQDILTSSGLHRDTLQSVVFARNTAWGDAARPLRLGRDWARESLSQVELYGVSTTAALAAHALALLPGDGLAIVGDDSAAAFSGRPGRLQAAGRMANAEVVLGSARHVAAALGLETQSPLEALDNLSQSDDSGEWASRFSSVLEVCDGLTVDNCSDRLSAVLHEAGLGVPGRLDDPAPAHIAVAGRRRHVAAGFCEAIAKHMAQVLRCWIEEQGGPAVVVTGEWFRAPRLTARTLSQQTVPITVSPLDTAAAAALGASLSVDPPTGLQVSTLAFAAGYTADEVKRSLDRCRIDYVYEPSWERLLARVGRMLARGKQVAWCQGRADIGRVSLGSRSILTDPSNRYARDNVNGYLLRRPLDAPLTVAMTEEVANEAVTDVVAGMAERFVTIASSWRARAAGVIDERGQNAVHVVTRSSAPELSDLLTHCRREHDMIGLVNVSLRCANGALAVSPVDAITAFFAAPIDALVIDRFLVMKDYWLLRSDSP